MQERNPHRVKIMWADGLVIEAHVLVPAGRVAIDHDRRKRNAAQGERQAASKTDRFNAGQRPSTLDEAAVKLAPAGFVVAVQERV